MFLCTGIEAVFWKFSDFFSLFFNGFCLDEDFSDQKVEKAKKEDPTFFSIFFFDFKIRITRVIMRNYSNICIITAFEVVSYQIIA